MYIYVCIHIYSVYMLLYKKASLLFLWVNTFYSTITITTVYIPNQNALIIYQKDIGLKQSVDHDQEVCNNMLNVTQILCVCLCMCMWCVCVCVCIWVWNSFPSPLIYVFARQTHERAHFPPATHMHTHPEKMILSAVSLVNFASAGETWSWIYFCCSAEFRDARRWTLRLFLHPFSLRLQINLAQLPHLNPNLRH